MINKKEYMERYRIENRKEIKKQRKQYRIENREKILEYSKKWIEEHPEYRFQYNQQWCKDNPEYHRQYIAIKRRIDLKVNINHRISSAIGKSLKGNKIKQHWEDLVGYTLSELKKYLEKTIPKGYTWQDFLKGKLHIDHKIPVSVFNYTKPEHIDFKRCWALGNLQLLPAKENIKKSNKLTKPFQPALAIS